MEPEANRSGESKDQRGGTNESFPESYEITLGRCEFDGRQLWADELKSKGRAIHTLLNRTMHRVEDEFKDFCPPPEREGFSPETSAESLTGDPALDDLKSLCRKYESKANEVRIQRQKLENHNYILLEDLLEKKKKLEVHSKEGGVLANYLFDAADNSNDIKLGVERLAGLLSDQLGALLDSVTLTCMTAYKESLEGDPNDQKLLMRRLKLAKDSLYPLRELDPRLNELYDSIVKYEQLIASGRKFSDAAAEVDYIPPPPPTFYDYSSTNREWVKGEEAPVFRRVARRRYLDGETDERDREVKRQRSMATKVESFWRAAASLRPEHDEERGIRLHIGFLSLDKKFVSSLKNPIDGADVIMRADDLPDEPTEGDTFWQTGANKKWAKGPIFIMKRIPKQTVPGQVPNLNIDFTLKVSGSTDKPVRLRATMPICDARARSAVKSTWMVKNLDTGETVGKVVARFTPWGELDHLPADERQVHDREYIKSAEREALEAQMKLRRRDDDIGSRTTAAQYDARDVGTRIARAGVVMPEGFNLTGDPYSCIIRPALDQYDEDRSLLRSRQLIEVVQGPDKWWGYSEDLLWKGPTDESPDRVYIVHKQPWIEPFRDFTAYNLKRAYLVSRNCDFGGQELVGTLGRQLDEQTDLQRQSGADFLISKSDVENDSYIECFTQRCVCAENKTQQFRVSVPCLGDYRYFDIQISDQDVAGVVAINVKVAAIRCVVQLDLVSRTAILTEGQIPKNPPATEAPALAIKIGCLAEVELRPDEGPEIVFTGAGRKKSAPPTRSLDFDSEKASFAGATDVATDTITSWEPIEREPGDWPPLDVPKIIINTVGDVAYPDEIYDSFLLNPYTQVPDDYFKNLNERALQKWLERVEAARKRKLAHDAKLAEMQEELEYYLQEEAKKRAEEELMEEIEETEAAKPSKASESSSSSSYSSSSYSSSSSSYSSSSISSSSISSTDTSDLSSLSSSSDYSSSSSSSSEVLSELESFESSRESSPKESEIAAISSPSSSPPPSPGPPSGAEEREEPEVEPPAPVETLEEESLEEEPTSLMEEEAESLPPVAEPSYIESSSQPSEVEEQMEEEPLIVPEIRIHPPRDEEQIVSEVEPPPPPREEVVMENQKEEPEIIIESEPEEEAIEEELPEIEYTVEEPVMEEVFEEPEIEEFAEEPEIEEFAEEPEIEEFAEEPQESLEYFEPESEIIVEEEKPEEIIEKEEEIIEAEPEIVEEEVIEPEPVVKTSEIIEEEEPVQKELEPEVIMEEPEEEIETVIEPTQPEPGTQEEFVEEGAEEFIEPEKEEIEIPEIIEEDLSSEEEEPEVVFEEPAVESVEMAEEEKVFSEPEEILEEVEAEEEKVAPEVIQEQEIISSEPEEVFEEEEPQEIYEEEKEPEVVSEEEEPEEIFEEEPEPMEVYQEEEEPEEVYEEEEPELIPIKGKVPPKPPREDHTGVPPVEEVIEEEEPEVIPEVIISEPVVEEVVEVIEPPAVKPKVREFEIPPENEPVLAEDEYVDEGDKDVIELKKEQEEIYEEPESIVEEVESEPITEEMEVEPEVAESVAEDEFVAEESEEIAEEEIPQVIVTIPAEEPLKEQEIIEPKEEYVEVESEEEPEVTQVELESDEFVEPEDINAVPEEASEFEEPSAMEVEAEYEEPEITTPEEPEKYAPIDESGTVIITPGATDALHEVPRGSVGLIKPGKPTPQTISRKSTLAEPTVSLVREAARKIEEAPPPVEQPKVPKDVPPSQPVGRKSVKEQAAAVNRIEEKAKEPVKPPREKVTPPKKEPRERKKEVTFEDVIKTDDGSAVKKQDELEEATTGGPRDLNLGRIEPGVKHEGRRVHHGKQGRRPTASGSPEAIHRPSRMPMPIVKKRVEEAREPSRTSMIIPARKAVVQEEELAAPKPARRRSVMPIGTVKTRPVETPSGRRESQVMRKPVIVESKSVEEPKARRRGKVGGQVKLGQEPEEDVVRRRQVIPISRKSEAAEPTREPTQHRQVRPVGDMRAMPEEQDAEKLHLRGVTRQESQVKEAPVFEVVRESRKPRPVGHGPEKTALESEDLEDRAKSDRKFQPRKSATEVEKHPEPKRRLTLKLPERTTKPSKADTDVIKQRRTTRHATLTDEKLARKPIKIELSTAESKRAPDYSRTGSGDLTAIRRISVKPPPKFGDKALFTVEKEPELPAQERPKKREPEILAEKQKIEDVAQKAKVSEAPPTADVQEKDEKSKRGQKLEVEPSPVVTAKVARPEVTEQKAAAGPSMEITPEKPIMESSPREAPLRKPSDEDSGISTPSSEWTPSSSSSVSVATEYESEEVDEIDPETGLIRRIRRRIPKIKGYHRHRKHGEDGKTTGGGNLLDDWERMAREFGEEAAGPKPIPETRKQRRERRRRERRERKARRQAERGGAEGEYETIEDDAGWGDVFGAGQKLGGGDRVRRSIKARDRLGGMQNLGFYMPTTAAFNRYFGKWKNAPKAKTEERARRPRRQRKVAAELAPIMRLAELPRPAASATPPDITTLRLEGLKAARRRENAVTDGSALNPDFWLAQMGGGKTAAVTEELAKVRLRRRRPAQRKDNTNEQKTDTAEPATESRGWLEFLQAAEAPAPERKRPERRRVERAAVRPERTANRSHRNAIVVEKPAEDVGGWNAFLGAPAPAPAVAVKLPPRERDRPHRNAAPATEERHRRPAKSTDVGDEQNISSSEKEAKTISTKLAAQPPPEDIEEFEEFEYEDEAAKYLM